MFNNEEMNLEGRDSIVMRCYDLLLELKLLRLSKKAFKYSACNYYKSKLHAV